MAIQPRAKVVFGNFLDLAGLAYYHGKAETIFAGGIEISGRTITLKSRSGETIGTVEVPQTVYSLATGSTDGLMSASDFTKLEGIADGATKVEDSDQNGFIKINGSESPVYQHPTSTAGALTAGLYKITTDANGHVTVGTAVTKADITGLGIPGEQIAYEKASADADGLMAKEDFTKLQGIAAGAQANVIEAVQVNGSSLPVTSKVVNIDLTPYAKYEDIASGINYRGSVSTYADLPTDGVKNGDMYNVEQEDAAHEIAAGTNVVWNGTSWDAMAPMFTITPIQNGDIDALFTGA